MDNQEVIMEYKTLEKSIGELKGDMKIIKDLLVGNEFDEDSGLIERIKQLERKLEGFDKRLSAVEKWKDRLVAIFLGTSIPTGYGILEIIKNAFGK